MRINTNKIRIYLAEKGMTQSDLAAAMGVSRAHVSAIMARGTCSTKTAGSLAKGLCVTVKDIVMEVC